MSGTWIIITDGSKVAGLLAKARELGGEVTAAVVGSEETANEAAKGADKVQRYGNPSDSVPAEAYAGVLAQAVADAKPTVVMTGGSAAERVLLGACAGVAQAPVLTAVQSIAVDGDSVEVEYNGFGGIVTNKAKLAAPAFLMVDAAGTAPEPSGGSGSVDQVDGEANALKITGFQPPQEAQVDLASARVVVGVGRGLKAEGDLEMINALAKALGAEVGCTRPLAEGFNWLPKDRYIGVSGAHIAPTLYLTAGISGQLQHMVGARHSGTIVAIDLDEEAPIMAECDFGVIGDIYQIVPALTKELGA